MSLLDKLTTSVSLPDNFESLEEGIHVVNSYIRPYSERLDSYEFYVDRRWIEVRGDMDFQEAILHVFKEGGQYMRIMEGDIETGSWEHDLNGFILQYQGGYEFYELLFLNENFFILRKHGDHIAKGNNTKYLFYTTESIFYKYEWPDILHLMFDTIYKQNSNYLFVLLMFIVVVAIMVFLSLV